MMSFPYAELSVVQPEPVEKPCFSCGRVAKLVEGHRVCEDCHGARGRCGRCGYENPAGVSGAFSPYSRTRVVRTLG
jgi:hypothetical protein